MEVILATLLIAVGFNLWMFLFAYFLKTDSLTDISYTTSFLVVSAYCYGIHLTKFSTCTFLMILVWAFRLGIYLLVRIRKIEMDKRFNNIRHSFIQFLAFWLLQGVTVFIMLLPATFLFSQTDSYFTNLSWIGFTIYLIGLVIETVSDYQKYTFKNNPKNKDKWIESGLWKNLRHPNYLGEILIWTGIYFFVFPLLSYPYNLIGAISPLYIFFLIVFVSGIPILERSSNKKWGKNPAYKAYKDRTNRIFPFIY